VAVNGTVLVLRRILARGNVGLTLVIRVMITSRDHESDEHASARGPFQAEGTSGSLRLLSQGSFPSLRAFFSMASCRPVHKINNNTSK